MFWQGWPFIFYSMSTRKKIGISILVLLVISIIAIGIFISFNKRQERLFSEYTVGQIHGANDAVVDIWEIHIYWVVHEYGLWDEMIDFINEPDTAWTLENLGEVLYWFDLDGLWILDEQGTIVYNDTSGCAAALSDTVFSDQVLKKLHQNKYVDFYSLADGRVLLLQGATIHPTGDEERETLPQGYLFMAKCWDDELMNMLETLTGSIVEVAEPGMGIPAMEHGRDSRVAIPYRGFDGQLVAWLLYSKRIDFADLLSKNHRILLLILVTIALLSFFLLAVVLRKWVLQPLGDVAEIIQKENMRKISRLKRASDEFNQIGGLLENFIAQKEALRLEKERAEEADRLKSAFLANVSHEIRTPMSGVMGFAELLREENLSNEQRKQYVEIIINSGQHLLHLIDDLIDLSRIDTGQVQVKNEAFHLEALLSELKMFFLENQLVREKRLEISVSCNLKEEDNLIYADRVRLRQVMINLINNAVKFTAKGTVEFGCSRQSPDAFLFFVKDTGPGIPKEYHDRIFERFTQGDAFFIHEKQAGTGLGLSISKGVVDIMGGRIWVESSPGAGATFYFTVPSEPMSVVD